MSHEEQMKKHCPECVGLKGQEHEDCMKKYCPQLLEVELAKKKKKKKKKPKRAYSSPLIIYEIGGKSAVYQYK